MGTCRCGRRACFLRPPGMIHMFLRDALGRRNALARRAAVRFVTCLLPTYLSTYLPIRLPTRLPMRFPAAYHIPIHLRASSQALVLTLLKEGLDISREFRPCSSVSGHAPPSNRIESNRIEIEIEI